MGRIAFMMVLLTAAPAIAQSDCHLGLMAGYVFGRSQHVPDGSAPLTDTFDVEGRGVGAKLGCLRARDGWRYGFAADLMNSNARGEMQMRDPNQNFSSETSIDWLATVRAVGGYQSAGGWMPYLTAGVAVASMKMRLCNTPASFCTTDSQSFWGLVGGAGVQYRFSRRFSANAEYVYFGFEDKPFSKSGTLVVGDKDVSVNPEAHVVRLGLNFHF